MKTQEESAVSINSKTLLLLESDDSVQEMVQSIVLDHDLAMQTAYNMEDALRLISQGRTFAFTFNLKLITTDPIEFARKLKRDYPDLLLLAILGEKHKGIMIELLQVGTYACLGTPLQAGDLTYNLSKIIANSS